MHIAIITGASSGMGQDFTKLLAKEDKNIDEFWLIARRQDRLDALAKRLPCPCRTLALDLTDKHSFTILSDCLELENPKVTWLVNAAGYGVPGRVADLSQDQQYDMVDLNCMALTAVTRAVLPYMQEGGRIVQFASASAFMPQPEFAVYAATKAYVLSFSRALNIETKEKRVSVTAVCPGPVNTDFLKNIGGELPEYKKFFIQESKKVVKSAYLAALRRKEVAVSSASIKALHIATKILPHKFILRFMK